MIKLLLRRASHFGEEHLKGKNILKVKVKPLIFTSPRTSSGQASRPYETVPIGTISSPSEGGRKPQGENHQALAVKGERHPTRGLELNPGHSGERRACYHSATKPLSSYWC